MIQSYLLRFIVLIVLDSILLSGFKSNQLLYVTMFATSLNLFTFKVQHPVFSHGYSFNLLIPS